MQPEAQPLKGRGLATFHPARLERSLLENLPPMEVDIAAATDGSELEAESSRPSNRSNMNASFM